MHLDTYQEEVDLPDDCVLQVIPALVILKLDVKTVLYAHFHLHGMQDQSVWSTGITQWGRCLAGNPHR